jgi:hypothetical protein
MGKDEDKASFLTLQSCLPYSYGGNWLISTCSGMITVDESILVSSLWGFDSTALGSGTAQAEMTVLSI